MKLDKKDGRMLAQMFLQLIQADASARAVFQRHKINDAIPMARKHEQDALSALSILQRHGIPLTRDENGIYKIGEI